MTDTYKTMRKGAGGGICFPYYKGLLTKSYRLTFSCFFLAPPLALIGMAAEDSSVSKSSDKAWSSTSSFPCSFFSIRDDIAGGFVRFLVARGCLVHFALLVSTGHAQRTRFAERFWGIAFSMEILRFVLTELSKGILNCDRDNGWPGFCE